MRQWIVIALAALVALGVSNEAEAGKKKDKSADTEEASSSDGIEIVETGLAQVDEFFAKAKAPIDTITNTKNALARINTDLNTALGLATGTPIEDAIADLKAKAEGKIAVATDGAMPKLSVEDGVPENVKTGVDAVNSGIDELVGLIGGLQELPTQIAALIQEGQQFSDPNTLKGMASNPVVATKAVPKVGKNLKALGDAKGEVEALISSIDSLKTTLTSIAG